MIKSKQKESKSAIPEYLKVSKIICWLLHFWILTGVVSLSIRVFLLATNAVPNMGFADFAYNLSQDYMQPFRGIFPLKSINIAGYLDVSAVFAIIIYLFLGWGFKALIDYIKNKVDLSNVERNGAFQNLEGAKIKKNDTPTKKLKYDRKTKNIA